MKIKSQLLDAQLESRATSPTKQGEIVLNTVTHKVEVHDGTQSRALVDTDSAQTLTNKTYTLGTASRAMATDGSGNLVASGTTATELGYVSGVTSSIQTQLNAKAASTSLTAHTSASSGAHAASAISNTPAGNLAASTVQGALDELQTDVDTRATSAALTTHQSTTATHGVTGAIVGTSDAQVLTNKDYDGGTAANNRRITIPANTKTNLDSLSRKAGTILYATDDAKLYLDDGSNLTEVGSTSTDNLISNPTAESGISGWSVFQEARTVSSVNTATDVITLTSGKIYDAVWGNVLVRYKTTGTAIGGLTNNTDYYVVSASGSNFKVANSANGTAIDLTSAGTGTHTFISWYPLTGSGGSPTTTFARTTTSPLQDKGSFLLTSGVTDTYGEGVATAFSIKDKDKGQMHEVVFDFKTTGFAGSSLLVAIYDVTNDALIQISNSYIAAASSPTQYVGTFTAASNSTSYKLLVSVLFGLTGATAMLDNVSVKRKFLRATFDQNNFLLGTIGVPYADAAAAPVDGIGGTPLAVRFSDSTSPLGDSSSHMFQPGALGDGVAHAMTIRRKDMGQVLAIDLAYELGVYGSYTDGDLQVWVIAPSGAVIQPSAYKIMKASGPTKAQQMTFQTESTGTSYKILIHQATATTSWGSLKYEIACGPQVKSVGPIMTDTQAYVTTLTNAGNAVASFTVKRIGADAVINGTIILGSTAPTGTIIFTLPSGLSMDDSRLPTGTLGGNAYQKVGTAMYRRQSDGWQAEGAVLRNAALTNTFYVNTVEVGSPIGDWGSAAIPITHASGNTITITNMVVPILGWSSSQQLSQDGGTRVVALSLSGDAPSAAAGNPIIFPTASIDTMGQYNASTGRYTIVEPGVYDLGGYIAASAAATQFQLYKNGLAGPVLGISGPTYLATNLSGMVQLAAGDIVDLRPNGTCDASSVSTFFIAKRQGPQQIAASERDGARYVTTAGQSLANNTSTRIAFATKDFDVFGSWNGTTFTFQRPGKLRFKAMNHFATNATGVRQLWIQKNGSLTVIKTAIPTAAGNCAIEVEDVIQGVAGTTVEIFGYQSSGSTLALSTNTGENVIIVADAGNY